MPVAFDDYAVATLRKGAILNVTATIDTDREAAFKISLERIRERLARTADLSR